MVFMWILKMYGYDAKCGVYFCSYQEFRFCGIRLVYACTVTYINFCELKWNGITIGR